MPILPKAIYRLSIMPVKRPMAHFKGLEQIFQQFIWNQKWPQIASAILRKNTKVGGITIPDTKLYYKGHCNENRKPSGTDIRTETDQWNTIESPEINPHPHVQLIFDKGGKSI